MSTHSYKNRHPSIAHVQQKLETVLLSHLQAKNPEWTLLEWKDVAAGFGIPLVWQGTRPEAVWQEPHQGGIRYILAEC